MMVPGLPKFCEWVHLLKTVCHVLKVGHCYLYLDIELKIRKLSTAETNKQFWIFKDFFTSDKLWHQLVLQSYFQKEDTLIIFREIIKFVH